MNEWSVVGHPCSRPSAFSMVWDMLDGLRRNGPKCNVESFVLAQRSKDLQEFELQCAVGAKSLNDHLVSSLFLSSVEDSDSR